MDINEQHEEKAAMFYVFYNYKTKHKILYMYGWRENEE